MKTLTRLLTTAVFLLVSAATNAQQPTRDWDAYWITIPSSEPNGYGVYYFRKTIDLAEVPQSLEVKVSGDNRYKLYVNGVLVSVGPTRGDLNHWRYETVDISKELKTGQNVLAAVVWNDGAYKPEANVSSRTQFILQGEGVSTDSSWKCTKDEGYKPMPVLMPTYYVAGPGEIVDMGKTVTDWKEASCDDSQWMDAVQLSRGVSGGMPERVGSTGSIPQVQLEPSPLPQMERTLQRLGSLRKVEGMEITTAFPSEELTIPANTKASLILDQGHLTNAYFTINFSRGAGSVIKAGYLESYFTEYPKKGNRGEIEGKTSRLPDAYLKGMAAYMGIQVPEGMEFILGRQDIIVSNGSEEQKFESLSWRTYRYVQLDIETKGEPLTIHDVYGTFTGYPFELKASLDTDDEQMKAIFETGWRTARLCAVDTYMDCPYYERLQYLGDSRIQALVSLYNSGDDRLVKNFLTLADISRWPEGVTMSRYPQTSVQIIPPFSLWYIGALRDFMMYADDTEFVRRKLPGMRQILAYFSDYLSEDGSLEGLPGWNFTDWVYTDGWNTGVAEKGADGHSALMDLQLLIAYQDAAALEDALGLKEQANIYRESSEKLAKAIGERYWDEGRGLYADRSERDHFSQHANALAIIAELAEGEEAKAIAEKILKDDSLAQASVYFKFYLHQALVKAGLGDGYMDWLGIWRENLAMGLTTWAEDSNLDGVRSDCHAWGASPNIEFFRTVLGIDSVAPGFAKVRIEPHLGDIMEIGGEMPHPKGSIKVSYRISDKGKLSAELTLPEDVIGVFVWNGTEYQLTTGQNNIRTK